VELQFICSRIKVIKVKNKPSNIIKLQDSDRELEEIWRYLKRQRLIIPPENKDRITRRLSLTLRKHQLNNFSELLSLMKKDDEFLSGLIDWLKMGRRYDKDSNKFTPLVIYENNKDEGLKKKETKTLKKGKNYDFFDFPKVSNPKDTKNLNLIFNILKKYNINFNAYKTNYFLRRLHSRMRRVGCETYKNYAELIDESPNERNLLVNALSINVTRFFRDSDLFDILDKKILPNIVAGSRPKIRIWSAGCAIGPEPYSLAILIRKKFGINAESRFEILATDINNEFLIQARKGIYSYELLKEMNPLLLSEFFRRKDKDIFELNEPIRKMVRFQTHDLRNNVPFKDLDLIMCRNVLIYFSKEQSEILFREFYKALNPNGYIVLGKCELIPMNLRDIFKVIDSKTRIYSPIKD